MVQRKGIRFISDNKVKKVGALKEKNVCKYILNTSHHRERLVKEEEEEEEEEESVPYSMYDTTKRVKFFKTKTCCYLRSLATFRANAGSLYPTVLTCRVTVP